MDIVDVGDFLWNSAFYTGASYLAGHCFKSINSKAFTVFSLVVGGFAISYQYACPNLGIENIQFPFIPEGQECGERESSLLLEVYLISSAASLIYNKVLGECPTTKEKSNLHFAQEHFLIPIEEKVAKCALDIWWAGISPMQFLLYKSVSSFFPSDLFSLGSKTRGEKVLLTEEEQKVLDHFGITKKVYKYLSSYEREISSFSSILPGSCAYIIMSQSELEDGISLFTRQAYHIAHDTPFWEGVEELAGNYFGFVVLYLIALQRGNLHSLIQGGAIFASGKLTQLFMHRHREIAADLSTVQAGHAKTLIKRYLDVMLSHRALCQSSSLPSLKRWYFSKTISSIGDYRFDVNNPSCARRIIEIFWAMEGRSGKPDKRFIHYALSCINDKINGKRVVLL